MHEMGALADLFHVNFVICMARMLVIKANLMAGHFLFPQFVDLFWVILEQLASRLVREGSSA